MKRTLMILLCSLMATTTMGQKREPDRPLTKTDYLAKSKSQERTATTLLACGTAMMIVGYIGFNNTYDSNTNGDTDVFGFLVLGGFAMDVASVPFFIGSSRNARKATTMVRLENQRLNLPRQNASASEFQPTVTVTIKFR
ncbi:MAG: hypothetical protein JNL40_16020 [Cyclobacteriaceae bacterium]|nr:hypothetical protein [Cyclobacteriaceae bacterium]